MVLVGVVGVVGATEEFVGGVLLFITVWLLGDVCDWLVGRGVARDKFVL